MIDHSPRASPDAPLVLSKALLRVAARLGISQQELARILGVSSASVSRLSAGARRLEPASKEGELALLLLRAARSLDALVGGSVESSRLWLRAPNHHTGGVPIEQMQTVTGLVHVTSYLDAMRGKT